MTNLLTINNTTEFKVNFLVNTLHYNNMKAF